MDDNTESCKSLRGMKSVVVSDTEADKEPQTCHHFSIRFVRYLIITNTCVIQTFILYFLLCSGYVSEVRKSNRDACWPFESIDGRNQMAELPDTQLPPMIIPNFRWWGCKSCLCKIDKIESSRENESFTKFCNSQCSDRKKGNINAYFYVKAF